MSAPIVLNETLQRTNARGTRYWSIALDGLDLHTASGTDPQRLRSRTKSFATGHAALKQFHTARRKKLIEGYIRPLAAPQKTGQVRARLCLPHSQQHDYFDVHPSQPRVLVASEQRPRNENAWLHEVDLQAATTREVFHDDGNWYGGSQTFSHRALYLGPTTALFAVNGRTWRVDLASGKAEPLASYQEHANDAHFNPHCVWPSRDAAGERALVFDRGDRLRVVDRTGAELFAVSLASATSECRAGAISMSGRRVVAYVVSRHIIYGHADAAVDQTQEVRVWDVDSAKLLYQVPFNYKLDRVGLSPDDRQLVVLREYAQGPAIFDLDSKKRCHVFDDPHRDDRWATCRTWAYSPNGSMLALGGHGVRVVDPGNFQTIMHLHEPHHGYHETRHLEFSSDSRMLFVGATSGEVVGWQVA